MANALSTRSGRDLWAFPTFGRAFDEWFNSNFQGAPSRTLKPRVDVEESAEAEHPESDLANAGIYVASRQVLDMIPEKPVADFGYDVLPQLVGKMYGYEVSGFFCDIGTLERLEYARRAWK